MKTCNLFDSTISDCGRLAFGLSTFLLSLIHIFLGFFTMMRPWIFASSYLWFLFTVTMLPIGIIVLFESLILICDESARFMSLLKTFIGTVIALLWTILGLYAFVTNYDRYYKFLDTGKFIADDMVSKFSVSSESDFKNNVNVKKNPALNSLWIPHFFFDNYELQLAVISLLLVCQLLLSIWSLIYAIKARRMEIKNQIEINAFENFTQCLTV